MTSDDQASFQELSHLEFTIKGIQSKCEDEKRDLEPEGYCHYCGEDIESPKLFCNGEHAAIFEKRRPKPKH